MKNAMSNVTTTPNMVPTPYDHRQLRKSELHTCTAGETLRTRCVLRSRHEEPEEEWRQDG